MEVLGLGLLAIAWAVGYWGARIARILETIAAQRSRQPQPPQEASSASPRY
jgi:hypothetical protein